MRRGDPRRLRLPSGGGRLSGPEAPAWGPVLLGGLALGFSFPPFPFPFLAWGALVPLMDRWAGAASGRRVQMEATAAFLVTFAVAFSWPLRHTFPETALVSLGGLLALPVLLALPFALAVPIRRRLGPAAGFAALAAFYLVLELGLSRGPLAFPWPLLGHTQAEALALNQFAEYTGAPGLTLWVLLLNGALFLLLRAPARRGAAVLALGALLVVPLLFGRWRLDHPPAPAAHLRVGLVQPALGAPRWADVHDTTRVHHLRRLSDSLLTASTAPLDLLVWPETALPPGTADRPALQSWVAGHGTPLLTGAITRAAAGPLPPAYHNSALLLRPGSRPQAYHKRRLVPFAEHVPFLDRWPWLASLAVPAGGVDGYRPGTGSSVLGVGRARLGVLICFETLFGDDARRAVTGGADLLVAITQDGWWGPSAGYRQHLAFGRLRAIELRRALVQVSVTGTTALVLPTGATALETAWMARTAHAVAVPLTRGTTFYARHGDWLSHAALALALALIAGTLVQARRPRKEPQRLTPAPTAA